MGKIYLNISLLIVFSLVIVSCQSDNAQSNSEQIDNSKSVKIEYDCLLAKKYGFDDYGMKKYVMAFLKRGPNRDLDSAKSAELQKAHLENINKMAESGQLVLAGPFFGNDDLRGIYIFNVTSIEEAIELTNTDPAIKAGSLVMELKEWYGSAALMAINDLHYKLAKTGITD